MPRSNRSIVATRAPRAAAEPVAPAAPGRLNISVENITPAMASAWLARGGKNRKLNERRVASFTAAMHRGEWRLTGDTVKLDADGRVRDGQHRLAAIVKSGLTVASVVVRGVDEEAFDAMDIGKARTTGDVLGMHGYVSGTAVAGASRLLIFFERYSTFLPTVRESQNTITPAVTLTYLEKHPDVTNGVRMGDRVRQAGLRGGISAWGALFTLFLRLDTEKAYQFAQHLVTGENLSGGHPALMLRNRLLWSSGGDSATGNSQKSRTEMAAMTIKAWNAFREGKTLHTLYYRDEGPRAEPFPKPV